LTANSNFVDSLDGQFGRLRALEDAIEVTGHAPKEFVTDNSVGDQASVGDEGAVGINGRRILRFESASPQRTDMVQRG
jgi:hypothetical protein